MIIQTRKFYWIKMMSSSMTLKNLEQALTSEIHKILNYTY